MIDKRQIIKEHLNDCEPEQLHDGSYVTIKECVEMMEILEQKLVKNLGLHNVSVSSNKIHVVDEFGVIDSFSDIAKAKKYMTEVNNSIESKQINYSVRIVDER